MFKITYTQKGKIEVTEAMKEKTEIVLKKLNKFFKETDEVNVFVLFSVVKHNDKEQSVEIKVDNITNSEDYITTEKNVDIYVALDLIIDKLERMIRKSRDKKRDVKISKARKKKYEAKNKSLKEIEKEINNDNDSSE